MTGNGEAVEKRRLKVSADVSHSQAPPGNV